MGRGRRTTSGAIVAALVLTGSLLPSGPLTAAAVAASPITGLYPGQAPGASQQLNVLGLGRGVGFERVPHATKRPPRARLDRADRPVQPGGDLGLGESVAIGEQDRLRALDRPASRSPVTTAACVSLAATATSGAGSGAPTARTVPGRHEPVHRRRLVARVADESRERWPPARDGQCRGPGRSHGCGRSRATSSRVSPAPDRTARRGSRARGTSPGRPPPPRRDPGSPTGRDGTPPPRAGRTARRGPSSEPCTTCRTSTMSSPSLPTAGESPVSVARLGSLSNSNLLARKILASYTRHTRMAAWLETSPTVSSTAGRRSGQISAWRAPGHCSPRPARPTRRSARRGGLLTVRTQSWRSRRPQRAADRRAAAPALADEARARA